MSSETLERIRAAIRTIPDYPRPGVQFRDITTLLGDARVFHEVVQLLAQPWRGMQIDRVAGIEARGFILGGAIAHELSAGFVPIRKKGKLPREYLEQLTDFMVRHVYPAEQTFRDQLDQGPTRWQVPPVMEELKAKARERGLWNLFLPESERGAGLTNLEYAPLCEIMGRSPIAPEAFNCSAPDTGNMETIERYGSPEQK